MKKKGNLKDFLTVLRSGFCENQISGYKRTSPDKILRNDFMVTDFAVDYSHAILEYYKASGCRILSWEKSNWDGRLKISYTKPTVWVDSTKWYTEVYREARLWSWWDRVLILSIIMIVVSVWIIATRGG